MRLFLRYWLPVLMWVGLIFIGSTGVMSAEQTSRFLIPFVLWLKPDISGETLAEIHLFVRKLGHVSEYAILAMLLWRALRGGTNLRLKMSIRFVMVWIVCGLFAAGDEFHQSFMPSRTAATTDVMIDIGGAFVGLVICWAFGRSKSVAYLRDGSIRANMDIRKSKRGA